MSKKQTYRKKLQREIAAILGEPVSIRQAQALAKHRNNPDKLKQAWKVYTAIKDTVDTGMVDTVDTPGSNPQGTTTEETRSPTSDDQKLTMVRHAVRVLSNLENVEKWASSQPPEIIKEVRGLLKLVAEHTDNYLQLWDAYNRLGRKLPPSGDVLAPGG